MATLLGLQAKEIMALGEWERPAALIQDLWHLPTSLLFRDLPRSLLASAHA